MAVEEEERVANGGKLNTLPGRFALAVKHKDIGDIVFRARFVIGGQTDKQKEDIVHKASATRAQLVRPLLAFAASLGFDVCRLMQTRHTHKHSAISVGTFTCALMLYVYLKWSSS